MALSFVGATQYGYASPNFNYQTPFSFTGTVNCGDWAPQCNFFYAESSSGFFDSIWAGADSTGNFILWINQGGVSTDYRVVLSPGVWYDYALVCDGVNFMAYLNGAIMKTTACAFTGGGLLSVMVSGGNQPGSTFQLQDVGLWSRALSAGEVAQLAAYRQTSAMNTGMYLWVPMQFDAGTPANELVDRTGNGHNLAPGGTQVADDPSKPFLAPAGGSVGGTVGRARRGGVPNCMRRVIR